MDMSLDRSLDEIIKDKRKSSVFRRTGKSDRQKRITKRRGKKPVKRSTYQNPSIDDEPWQHDLNQEDDSSGSVKYIRKGRDRNTSSESLHTVIIENLHYELSEENIRSLLSDFHPHSIEVDYDRAGRSEGTCRAFFFSKGEASNAVNSLEGRFVNDQPIKLYLKPPTSLLDRISFSGTEDAGKEAPSRKLRRSNKKRNSQAHSISHEDLDRELDAYAASYQAPASFEDKQENSSDNTRLEGGVKGDGVASVQDTEDMQLDDT
ncbi:THO complex subunit [Schizosaccharomyces octosporus yFS286]|uniref:THO complex subunit n=1 Tax=Schizosaccharomyces octosporus (strain yFS286) TaxID=483514 RepID=S9PWH1_SCHOY|nr:THO complex subunit [Schizosaccharomyces octosporus yFS286]EPX73436.1 THO complex subunit [Schizosaccharomyces octosporus yFS286]